jgi:hypothetical protein
MTVRLGKWTAQINFKEMSTYIYIYIGMSWARLGLPDTQPNRPTHTTQNTKHTLTPPPPAVETKATTIVETGPKLC